MRTTPLLALLVAGALSGPALAQGIDGGGGFGMMQARGAMHHGERYGHIDGKLAFLKTELKITANQEQAWSQFADAARKEDAAMKAVFDKRRADMQKRFGAPPAAETTPVPGAAGQGKHAFKRPAAPERLDAIEDMLKTRLDQVHAMKTPTQRLYQALGDAQKETADKLLFGPWGVL